MLFDFPCPGKLRFAKPVNGTAALGPVVDRPADNPVDLSRTRVVCDRVQYRSSFHDVVDIRPVLAADGGAIVLRHRCRLRPGWPTTSREVAINSRRRGASPPQDLAGHQRSLPNESAAAHHGDRIIAGILNGELSPIHAVYH